MKIPWFHQLSAHDGFRRYGANSFWLLLEKSVRMLLGLITSVCIARQLGPDQFGLFNYALSFVWIFAFLPSLGLDSVVTRDLLRHPEEKNRLLGTAFLLKLSGALVMLVVVAAVQACLPEQQGARLLVLLIGVGYLFQSLQVIEFYFQAKVQIKYPALAQIMAMSISYGLKLYLAWVMAPLWCFAAAEALYWGLAAGGSWYFFHQGGERCATWHFSSTIARRLLRDSWPLMAVAAALMVYTRADQILLKFLMADADIGYYAAAVKAVEMAALVPSFICLAVYPALVNARHESHALYRHRLRQLFAFITWGGIAISLAITVTAAPLIRLLLGPEYAESASVMRIYAWNVVFFAMIFARHRWLVVENRQNYELFFSGVGCVINVGANYLLILAYGVAGCAWATLLSSFTSAYLLPLCCRSTRGVTLEMFRALLPGRRIFSATLPPR